MIGEEFQEADVFWPDISQDHRATPESRPPRRRKPNTRRRRRSAPIDIPRKMGVSRSWAPGFATHQGFDDDDEGISEDEIIPPHILVVRRASDVMAFSVCTGNGRTLKGRDLRRVRNFVLRMTGFLER